VKPSCSQRGAIHPKDMTFHVGDPWSPYKSTMAHYQGRKILIRDLERTSQRKNSKAELPRWKTSSQGWDTIGDFGEVWKRRSIGGMCEA
jgi:hypothetical protein